jgi:predicted ribosome quality control (RQC) complex YloA/Tae2 family protein
MPFDGIVLAAVAAQLSELITGGRIEKIYQPERDELILYINARRERRRLFISSNGAGPRICLTGGGGPYPPAPPGFCMSLRKHIQGGRVSLVSQPGSERILELSVDTVTELGFSRNKKLIVEIMGKHSNIILVDSQSGRIIDSIRRLSPEMNRYRQTLPGCPYIAPPSHGKIPWDGVSLRDIREMTAPGRGGGDEASYGDEAGRLAACLVAGIQGISPRAAGELAGRALVANGDPDDPAGALFAELSSLSSRIASGGFSPRVYIDEEGCPADFHAFPMSLFEGGFSAVSFSGMSEAVDYYYSNKASSSRLRQKSAELTKAARSGLDKLLLKKQRVSEELAKAEDGGVYKLSGELLTAFSHTVAPGRSSVTLTNYYDGKPVTIALDPRLTPQRNALRYYKLYSKAKTAVVEKAAQLALIDRDAAYLESVLAFIENASAPEDIDSLRLELAESGYLKRRKAPSGKKTAAPGFLSYGLSEGFQALAGRSNKENDLITFKRASAGDLWFHTKDIPGAHVVLITGGRRPPENVIFEAAAIAAWHSGARASENVPVDYCLVKHVKKPPGAKPGMVIFTNNRTLYVNPLAPAPAGGGMK